MTDLQFSDIFNLGEIQHLQDLFSDAMGVASIITHPDGTPITQPSNFCRLCNDIIRKTDKGRSNCFKSDAAIGRQNPSGPTVQPCLSGGLWDAGASITVGGKHVANWLIGQVRNEQLDEHRMLQYADEIGVNREKFMEALAEVPVMSVEQFDKVSKMLYAFANELSDKLYTNLQLNNQIAEREKEKKLLKESEESLSITLQSIGDGVIATDKDGLVTRMNPVAEILCGWRLEDALGKPFHEVVQIVDSETREPVGNPVKKVLESGQITGLSNHTVLLAKDGAEYMIADSVAPIKNEEGEISGVVLVFSDVSEKYTLHEELKKSEWFLKETQKIAQLGTYVLNIETGTWSSSEILDDIFGIDPEYEKSVQGWAAIIHPEWQQIMMDHFTIEVLRDKGKFDKEYKIIRQKDKEERWVHGLGELIFDELNQPVRMIGTIRDITKQKQTEEEIRKLNETLEERVAERTKQLEATNKEFAFHTREMEQFTYIASHDLQEPLRTLTNFAQLLREDYGGLMDEDGNKYIEFLYNSAGRMRELVKGLLEYSFLGKEGVLTMVDCNKIVGEVLSDMAGSIEESKANITVGELPKVYGYSIEMRLLFQNLINNAIKFRKKKIRPEIKISAEEQKKEFIFTIEDNGIGIEEKDREKIFIIFKRMHNQNEYEGTGIGLSHCKKIVELHGGKIWVESKPGKGSIFIFTIPKP